MSRWHHVVALLAVCAVALGCETRARQLVKEQLAQKAKEGQEEIEKELAKRDEWIAKTIEELNLADLKWDPATPHPLLKWRQKVVSDDKILDFFRARAKRFPGNALSVVIPTEYIQFFEKEKRFWHDLDVADVREYDEFLAAFIRDYSKPHTVRISSVKDDKGNPLEAQAPANPLVAEALFDRVFIHAVHLFRLYKVPPENRSTSFFRYWQIAFDFPSKPAEAFQPYIARLCDRDEQMRDFCAKIPFEFRHIAMMHPYYDRLIALIDKLAKEYPKSPFVPVAQYLRKVFEQEKAKLAKEFVEYPVLPDSMALLPANQRLTYEIGPKGVRVANAWIAQDAAEKFRLTVPRAAALAKKIAEQVRTIRETGGVEIRQASIAVLADRTYPAAAVLELARASVFQPEEKLTEMDTTIYLVGRRRFDRTNLKVSDEVRLLKPKETPNWRIAAGSTAAQCTGIAFTGQPPVGELPKPVAAALVLNNGKLVAGPYDPKTGTISTIQLEVDLNENPWRKIDQWASAQRGAMVLGSGPGATWDAYMRALGPLAFHCKDDTCENSQPRLQPNVFLGLCR